mgnify:CR=1 FL=1
MLKLRRWMRQRELLRLLDKPRYVKSVDRKLADTFFHEKSSLAAFEIRNAFDIAG